MGVLAASSVVRWRLCRSHIFIALYLAPRLVCVPAGVGAVECDRLDAPASLSEGVHSSGRLFCVIVHRLSLDWAALHRSLWEAPPEAGCSAVLVERLAARRRGFSSKCLVSLFGSELLKAHHRLAHGGACSCNVPQSDWVFFASCACLLCFMPGLATRFVCSFPRLPG